MCTYSSRPRAYLPSERQILRAFSNRSAAIAEIDRSELRPLPNDFRFLTNNNIKRSLERFYETYSLTQASIGRKIVFKECLTVFLGKSAALSKPSPTIFFRLICVLQGKRLLKLIKLSKQAFKIKVGRKRRQAIEFDECGLVAGNWQPSAAPCGEKWQHARPTLCSDSTTKPIRHIAATTIFSVAIKLCLK